MMLRRFTPLITLTVLALNFGPAHTRASSLTVLALGCVSKKSPSFPAFDSYQLQTVKLTQSLVESLRLAAP
jgi:hypothetical protein